MPPVFDDCGYSCGRHHTPEARYAQRLTGGLKRHFLIQEGIMDDAGAKVVDLIFGRWRSQKFGFDHGAGHPSLFLDDAKAPNC